MWRGDAWSLWKTLEGSHIFDLLFLRSDWVENLAVFIGVFFGATCRYREREPENSLRNPGGWASGEIPRKAGSGQWTFLCQRDWHWLTHQCHLRVSWLGGGSVCSSLENIAGLFKWDVGPLTKQFMEFHGYSVTGCFVSARSLNYFCSRWQSRFKWP